MCHQDQSKEGAHAFTEESYHIEREVHRWTLAWLLQAGVLKNDGWNCTAVAVWSGVRRAAIAAGRRFIVFLGDGFFPVNVPNALKMVPEFCRIFCATDSPTQIVLAQNEQGHCILGIVDGLSPKGIEDENEIKWKKGFLRKIGCKLRCDGGTLPQQV